MGIKRKKLGRSIITVFILFFSISGILGVWNRSFNPLYFIFFPLLFSFFIFKNKDFLILFLILSLNFVMVRLTGGIKSEFFFSYLVPLAVASYIFDATRYGAGLVYVIVMECLALSLKKEFFISPLLLLAIFALTTGFIINAEKKRRGTFERAFLKEKAKKKIIDPLVSAAKEKVKVLREDIYSVDVEDLSGKILDSVYSIIAPHTVAFFVVDEERGRLLEGISKSLHFNKEAEIEKGKGITGWALKEKRDVFINEYYESSILLGYYKRDVFVKSVGVVCIKEGENIHGLLVADYLEKNGFNRERKDFLKKTGLLFADVLKIARMFEQRQKDALRFSALYEFSEKLFSKTKKGDIYDSFLLLLNLIFSYDGAGILEMENNTAIVVKTKGNVAVSEGEFFRIEKGIMAFLSQHEGFYINPDVRREGIVVFNEKERKTMNRGFLGVSYKIEDKRGVVWIEKNEPGYFTHRDGKMAEFLSRVLSTALLRARYAEKLEELARIDGLTGVLNHRAFQEKLEEVLQKEKNVTLLMIDIDHFKKINDTYGHPFGDKVLRKLGSLLKRKNGISARYGGEEFALILPGIPKNQGIIFAEKLLEDIRDLEFDREIKITASIGIACYPEDARNKSALIDTADKCLYKAKREGRNRVVWV